MADSSSAYGVRSMYAPLTRVAIHTPTTAGGFAAAGRRAAPGPARSGPARRLRTDPARAGADVEVLSETPGRRLGLLLHAAFVTGRGAIVLDPATPAHRGEVEVMARDLTELGIPIAAGSPAT